MSVPLMYSFCDLNKDMDDLYAVLREENFKDRDIYRLIQPLMTQIPPPPPKQTTSKVALLCFNGLLMLLCLATVTYVLTYWETFYWHLSALSRIALIKVLPYFDWRYLKNEVCLVPLNGQLEVDAPLFNCDLCESLGAFEDFTYDFNRDKGEECIQRFVDLDRPIVVRGGLEGWGKKPPREFIEGVLQERGFAKSLPCKLSTNVYNLRRHDDIVDVETLVTKHSRFFNSFFMHFQNCDLEAVKIFRKFTYRPEILPATLSPVTYNWVLWNRNYNATGFKKIELQEKYTLIGQIFGRTQLRLVPRKNCADFCAALNGVLSAGQFLVLTSLWDVEYRPVDVGEHMAAILEIKG